MLRYAEFHGVTILKNNLLLFLAMSNWDKTVKIVKDTFALAKKDPSLYFPVLLEIFVWLLVLALAMIAVLAEGGIFLAIFIIFLGFLASAFLDGALSFMVLETVQGKKAEFGRGLGRAFKQAGSLVVYAIVGLIIMIFVSSLRDNRNDSFIAAIIKNIFAGMIEEAWDIAGHFMLPAIVLKQHSFTQAAKELTTLTKHIPQALVGGFAFDFVVRWLYLLELILGVVLMFGLGMAFGVAGFLVGLFVMLLLMFGTYVLYSFTKSVYFTLLYIQLHPELKRK
jgi:hypothetical protein